MRIILIEDNEIMSKVLRLMLEPAEVVVCGTMAEAERIMDFASPGDTVVVDLKLPDSQPASTLCRIAEWKNRDGCPRVVIITGSTDPVVLAAARSSPADALALKNTGEKFYQVLRHIGQERQNEPCANRQLVEQVEAKVAELCRA